jgi:acyl-CoA reductase-like NAD-dependent aldehyde dehydrogenase
MQVGLLLKPGPQEPWTPYRMAAAFLKAGVPKEAIAIYPGGGDIGAEVVRRARRSMIFGGNATVERYKGDTRVQVHGSGFSKILLGDDVVGQWEKYLDVIVDSVFLNSGAGVSTARAFVPRATPAKSPQHWPSGWDPWSPSLPRTPRAV